MPEIPKAVRAQPEQGSHPRRLSKLNSPAAARYRVTRSQITDRVFNADGARVVLVRGPAGFGKTTVLQQLHQRYLREGTPCAWINLDEADNDPPRFLTYFGLALRNILHPEPGDAALFEQRARKTGTLAVTLMERIERHREPIVLFFDEFETIKNPAVLALIAYGVEHLPVGSQVIIGSRTFPEIGLARMRARGQLLEFDPSSLRFTLDETGDFLIRQRGLSLTPEQIQSLHRTTEGWVAALWLASVALEGRRNPDEFISGFTGSNAAVADYLAEDVLKRQPDAVREFLLKTCVLDQLDAEACDAVCGRNDSVEQLQAIERANLFLMPVDENRSAYRYHSLFAGFLRGQLKRLHPELHAQQHRNASDWFLRTGRPIPAIEHALASGNLSYAIDLLGQHADDLLGKGRLRLLTRWFDTLPAGALEPHPRLRTIQAWAVTFSRGAQCALRLIEGTETLDDSEAHAQLLALRPMLLGMMDRVSEAHDLALARVPLIQKSSRLGYGMLAQCLANTSMVLGRFGEARHYADQVRQTQAGSESSFHVAIADTIEGAIDLMQGRLRQATARLRIAAGASGDELVDRVSRNLFPGVLLAEVLYEAGDSETAKRLLSIFVPMAQDLGLADQLITAHVLLARILEDAGDVDASIKVLTDLDSVGQRLGLQRAVACARLERARSLVMRSDFSAAKDQLQLSGDAAFWSEVSSRHYVANDLATQAIGKYRWMIRSGAEAAAIPPLKESLESAEHQHRHRRALKLRLLLAEALHRDGQRRLALRMLSRALSFAAPEGFFRTFLEEGPTLQALLVELLQAGESEADMLKDDAAALLKRMTESRQAVSAAANLDGQAGLAEPLSKKEMKVLELLGQGHSNSGIAEKLFVSENTVRSHLRTINVKLQAGSRTQAIVIARRLKLIP